MVGELLAQDDEGPEGAEDGRHREPQLRLGRRGLALAVALEPRGPRAREKRRGEEQAELLWRQHTRPGDELAEDRVYWARHAAHLRR